MSDANELHPVGLVASSVDPTIKSGHFGASRLRPEGALQGA